LLSYGSDLVDTASHRPFYVDRILRGANPGDLPVQFPTKFEMILNRKTAMALGLTVPLTLQAIADQVTEKKPVRSVMALSWRDGSFRGQLSPEKADPICLTRASQDMTRSCREHPRPSGGRGGFKTRAIFYRNVISSPFAFRNPACLRAGWRFP
jgi:hypothetical protein